MLENCTCVSQHPMWPSKLLLRTHLLISGQSILQTQHIGSHFLLNTLTTSNNKNPRKSTQRCVSKAVQDVKAASWFWHTTQGELLLPLDLSPIWEVDLNHPFPLWNMMPSLFYGFKTIKIILDIHHKFTSECLRFVDDYFLQISMVETRSKAT